jgi:hypothetical protein
MKVIAAALGVSSASVHNWTADIELTPELTERIAAQAQALRTAAWKRRNRVRRQGYQREGRERAPRRFATTDRPHVVLGRRVEEPKRRDLRQLGRLHDAAVRQVLGRVLRRRPVTPDDATQRLHVERPLDRTNRGALARGSRPSAGLPSKAHPQPLSDLHERPEAEQAPYGVCCLTLYDTRIAQHIYGAIQEYGRFEEPRWLDGPPIKRRPRQAAVNRWASSRARPPDRG